MVSRNAIDLFCMPQYQRGSLNTDFEKKPADGYGGNQFDDVYFYGNSGMRMRMRMGKSYAGVITDDAVLRSSGFGAFTGPVLHVRQLVG